MGFTVLPDPGGVLDQSSAMMEALQLMAAFESKITAPKAPPYNDDGEVDLVEQNRIAAKSWGVDL